MAYLVVLEAVVALGITDLAVQLEVLELLGKVMLEGLDITYLVQAHLT
jgi:hypothetical protein